MAIQSFASRAIERFFNTGRVPKRAGWAAASRVAARKLDMLDYAHELLDLASPPGNRLKALKGDLRGLHSIRVNDQWRGCSSGRLPDRATSTFVTITEVPHE